MEVGGIHGFGDEFAVKRGRGYFIGIGLESMVCRVDVDETNYLLLLLRSL